MCLGMGLLVVAGSLFVQVILEGSKKPNENRHLSRTSIKITPKKNCFLKIQVPSNPIFLLSSRKLSIFLEDIVNIWIWFFS